MNDDIKRLDWVSRVVTEAAPERVSVRIERDKDGFFVWIGRVRAATAPTLRLAIDAAMLLVAA